MQRIRNQELVLLDFLIKLSKEKGYAYPTNSYLAKANCVSDRTIRRYLSKLIQNGLIRTKTVRVGKFDHRYIFVTENGFLKLHGVNVWEKLSTPIKNKIVNNKINSTITTEPTATAFLTLPLCYNRKAYITLEYIREQQKKHTCNIKEKLVNISAWFKKHTKIRYGFKNLLAFLDACFMRSDNQQKQKADRRAMKKTVCTIPLQYGRVLKITGEMVQKWQAKHICDIRAELEYRAKWQAQHPNILYGNKASLCKHLDKWFATADQHTKRRQKHENARRTTVLVLPMCYNRDMRITSAMLKKWSDKYKLSSKTITERLFSFFLWLIKHPNIRYTRKNLIAKINTILAEIPQAHHTSSVHVLKNYTRDGCTQQVCSLMPGVSFG